MLQLSPVNCHQRATPAPFVFAQSKAPMAALSPSPCPSKVTAGLGSRSPQPYLAQPQPPYQITHDPITKPREEPRTAMCSWWAKPYQAPSSCSAAVVWHHHCLTREFSGYSVNLVLHDKLNIYKINTKIFIPRDSQT